MDELEISGKRYISTRRAAREHGYHSDYMGQLIRGKKVAGEKVGRAWYIDEQSLAAYLGKETQKPASVPEAPEPVVEEKIEIIEEPKKTIEVIEETIEAKPEEAIEVKAQEIKEEEETKIPIHIPAAAIEEIQEVGGLRYTHDDTPSLPIITRMPQAHSYVAQSTAAYAPHRQQEGRSFPIVSLSMVALVAIAAAAFASNFVSATIISQPGEAAAVTYAIHW